MTDQIKTARDDMPHKQPLKPEDIIWLERFIHDQCNGIRQLTMCVPVQDDDSDMVLSRILNHLKQKSALDQVQTPAPIDVEALKRPEPVFEDEYSPYRRGYERGKQLGWNDCIDHLHAQGYLSAKLPKIDGLDEALLVADYVSRDVMGMDAANRAYNSKTEFKEKYGKRHEYVIEQAARAYRERME